jgi:ABC-type sugar transport system permease subunit
MVLGGFLAVWFAFALNRATAGLRFLRGLSLVPYIVSSIAAAVLFRMLFNRDFGLANRTLQLFGLEGIGWLSDPIAAMFAVVVTQVWTDLPIAILIVLGGTADDRSGPTRCRICRRSNRVAAHPAGHAATDRAATRSRSGLLELPRADVAGRDPRPDGWWAGPSDRDPVDHAMYDTAFRLLDQGGALAIMVIIFAINAALTVIYIWFGRQRTV